MNVASKNMSVRKVRVEDVIYNLPAEQYTIQNKGITTHEKFNNHHVLSSGTVDERATWPNNFHLRGGVTIRTPTA